MLVLYHNDNEFDEVPLGDPFDFHLMRAKIVDVQGEPRVVEKDVIINDDINVLGRLTACRHANGRDWWLLQFKEDKVYNYLITPEGIILDHEQTLPFVIPSQSFGQTKFSPAGDKFASYGISVFNSDTGLMLMIADFDRCTGDLIDPQIMIMPSHGNSNDNGLEFSPDCLLYTSPSPRDRQKPRMPSSA